MMIDNLESGRRYSCGLCLFTVLAELDGHRTALEKAAAKETELFTPQQYEATFERRLFRNTLGLDVRLTQGECKQNFCSRVKQLFCSDRLISLVFSHVDHEQPDRQFRVTLDVSDAGQWEGKLATIILNKPLKIPPPSCKP